MKKHEQLRERIYKLKVVLLGISLVLVGLVLALLADWLEAINASHLLVAAAKSLSDVLVVTGGFGIAIDFVTERDREEADVERTRAVLKELTPDFTDAVVKGFSVGTDDLKRVATPGLLDGIVTNALALRLGDQQFATEIYAELRDQVIKAPERWYDVQVRARLSTAVERSAAGAPLFDVLVEWEYTTIPSHPVQRFACVSDRAEFNELTSDIPTTLTWFMTARDGLEARNRRNYELLAFSVDGDERPIRRSERASGQLYSANVGAAVVAAGKPVRVRHLYRVVTPQSGHRLYFEVGQPTRGFSLEVDYTDTDIERMSVTELVSSNRRSQVSRTPEQVDVRVLGIDLPGAWLLPKDGFAFVWTLASEQRAAGAGTVAVDRSKTS